MPKDISSSKLRFNIHNQIQDFFDDVILKRGLDYLHKGIIQEVYRKNGHFYSTVEGTYPYNVKIEIKDEFEAKRIENELSNSYKIESSEEKAKNKQSKPP